MDSACLFGFVLLLHLLNLTSLLLKLLLLLLKLLLSLLIRGLLILHLVADRKTSHTAQRSTNCGTRAGRSDRSSDYRSGSGPNARSAQSSLLTRGERCPRTSCDQEPRGYRQNQRSYGAPVHRRRHCFTFHALPCLPNGFSILLTLRCLTALPVAQDCGVCVQHIRCRFDTSN